MNEKDESTLLKLFRRSALGALSKTLAVAIVCASIVQFGIAQQPTQSYSPRDPLPTGLTGGPLPELKMGDDQYRIGPEDEISIQIFGKPQLSRDQIVDAHGMIRMPLLDENIRAACRTEDELAEEIARMYREHDLLRNPAVYVSVKTYQSQPVAVLGSVATPARFILRRSIRLRELIVFFAGGPTANAGRQVQILSTSPAVSCEPAANEAVASRATAQLEGSLVTYDIQDLLSGREASNPIIHRGDIINIPAAEQVFIVGNVMKPSAIPIVGPTTLARALAMVGGTLPNSKKEKIRVSRQVPGNSNTAEILVDLTAADKSNGADFLLQGGDIVEVNTKTGLQKVLVDMARAVVPSLTNMPYRIIP